MRKIIVYLAVSLDGYVADKDGGVGFLGGDGSDPENMGSYPEFYESIDTVILGYTTYHQIVTELSPEQWPYEGKESIVLTHRELEDKEGIRFTSGDIKELMKELKAKDGKDIWICGGAAIINQLIDADLVDEYTCTMMPTILGEGIRLFESRAEEKKLKLISTKVYNGIVDLKYERR